MHDEFKMSMMGELNFFLGLQRKQMEDGIFFNQSKYIKEMLKKFSLEDSKPMKTPISSDTKLTKEEECESVDSTKYRGMIGSLLYLTASRPDIMFSVCLCARFQEAPKTSHLEVVKRIFILKAIIDYDKTYAPVARLKFIRILLAYSCALDFKLFQMDVKSALLNGFINEEVYVAQPPGFIDFEKPDHVYKLKKALYGLKQEPKLEDSKPMKTPMSSDTKLTKDEECESVDSTKYRGMIGTTHLGLWYPNGAGIETVVYADSDHAGDYKQTALAISTAKAEYVSVGKACQQALWMKQALIDYDIQLDDVPIVCDNKGAIDLSKNPVQHSRTKHIEIRHHFLRDNVQKGHISIEKVPSVDNIADILTKPLKRESFNYLRLGLGIMEPIP
ncbi:copia protein [Tanacetum coccineum]